MHIHADLAEVVQSTDQSESSTFHTSQLRDSSTILSPCACLLQSLMMITRLRASAPLPYSIHPRASPVLRVACRGRQLQSHVYDSSDNFADCTPSTSSSTESDSPSLPSSPTLQAWSRCTVRLQGLRQSLHRYVNAHVWDSLAMRLLPPGCGVSVCRTAPPHAQPHSMSVQPLQTR